MKRVNNIKRAFTLAEVLITLGIIGIVAALVIPTLMSKYKEMVLRTQFKKAYSTVQQAWKKAEADMGYTPQCHYWKKRPVAHVRKCVETVTNVLGSYCGKYEYTVVGTPEPRKDCAVLWKELEKNLNVIKVCEKNALKNGCIAEYEGFDTVKLSKSGINIKPGDDNYNEYMAAAARGCANFSKSNIANKLPIMVLGDGVTIILYSRSHMLFAMDINGKKGPNKWGYDIFEIQPKANEKGPITLAGNGCGIVEKGGKNTTAMILESLK